MSKVTKEHIDEFETLFHQIYGSGRNLDNQFNCFYEDMKQHKYDAILNL